MNKLLILLLASFIITNAQVEQSKSVNPYAVGPVFNIDVANYEGTLEGKTRVDIFIQLPYSNLSFVREGNGYSADYSVTLTFFTEDKESIIYESLWNEKVNVESFNSTQSTTGQNLSYRKVELTPGKYLLKCTVEDLHSKRNVSAESIANVKKFGDEISLSDIVLVAKRFNTAKGENVIPNVSRVVSTDFKNLDLFYEVYSLSNKKVTVEYSIEDKDENNIYAHQVDHIIKTGKNLINYNITEPNFSLGDYFVYVRLKDESGDELAAVRKNISSKLVGFPIMIKNLDIAVKQMQYIASNEELDFIEESENYNEKLKRFKDYWKKKDPSPNTIENEVLSEYYRRVAYASKNFKSYYDGWRTDMGMIYITLGPPNQVDRHPFDYDSKPYEVWDYYQLNRRFVFIDHTGFGDYRLVDRNYGDWNRYRY